MRTDKTINENIFLCDVEIPRIVQEKADSALASVRKDAANGSMEESEMTRKTKKRNFKRWSGIAAAAAVVVMLGGGIVFAAINHFWSDGMREVLEAEEEQLQTLEEQGNVQVFDPANAATVDGITVRPMEMVADSTTALITFLVSGVDDSIGSGDELLFEWIRPELDEGFFAGASGSFYSDKITAEDGTEGFEYVMSMYSIENGQTASLLGQQLHIELGRLALSGGKAELGDYLTEGTWEFDIRLPDKDPATVTINADVPLSDTVYTVNRIELSPLSLQVYYRINGDVEITRENNNIPIIRGIRMKDGTVIDSSSRLESGYPALGGDLGHFLYDNPEEAVWDDEIRMHPKRAYVQVRFNQVIDPAQVAEVILQPWGEAYAWGDLPDEIVAEEYGGEIPFERVDVNNIEYWNVPLE